MKSIHVECLPDEALVRKLGFTRKMVTHHAGKSRVLHKLKSVSNQLAIVDEDPGSVKSDYEKKLIKEIEINGLTFFKDKSGNIVIQLKGKLEDWILNQCENCDIKIGDFGFPNNGNKFHDVINLHIPKFEEVVDCLIKKKSAGMIKLKSW